LAVSLPKHLAVDTVSDTALLASKDTADPKIEAVGSGRLYRHMLIHIQREDIPTLPDLLRAAEQHLAPDGTMSVFIEHRNADLDGGNMSAELPRYADLIMPPRWISYQCSGRYAGGALKLNLRKAERSLYPFLRPLSFRRLPLIIFATAGWFLIGGVTALNNLSARRKTATFPDHCSSMLLSLSRRNRVSNR
jgi:hypothetical protein